MDPNDGSDTMDPKLEQLMGRAREAASARTVEDGRRAQGRGDPPSADVQQHTRRWTDRAQQRAEHAVDHAKDFSHRRT
ncbi:MAG: hypothetical protein JWN72_2196 [Thermoleophilia bacterium]|nr:hypothetical protein [Thermoleophilia bacterium]